MLLIGSKLRAAGAEKQAIELADALGCAVTVMAAAKSFFPEDHPQFAGIYWGEISAPGAREIVDWADGVVCIGTIFNDYSTVGWTAMPSGPSVLTADQNRVYFDGYDFGGSSCATSFRGLPARSRSVTRRWLNISASALRAAARNAGNARRQADAGRNRAADPIRWSPPTPP